MLCMNCDGKVEHYRIMYHASKLSIDEEVYFKNLMQLVEHYTSDADGPARALPRSTVPGWRRRAVGAESWDCNGHQFRVQVRDCTGTSSECGEQACPEDTCSLPSCCTGRERVEHPAIPCWVLLYNTHPYRVFPVLLLDTVPWSTCTRSPSRPRARRPTCTGLPAAPPPEDAHSAACQLGHQGLHSV